jgi:anti-sigma regulatory factor (Ser/Thr protein kinase)
MSVEVDGDGQFLQAARPARKPMAPVLWWTRDFPGSKDQVSQARGWLEELLPECEQLEVLTLLASELGTNAILHTDSGKPGGRFSLSVEWTPEAVKALIVDQGSQTVPSITVKADATAWDDEDGRGLFLVDQLADDWGTADLTNGRMVWLDIAWAAKGGPLLEVPGGYRALIRDVKMLRREFPAVTVWWGHRSALWWAALPGPNGETGLVHSPAMDALTAILANAYPSICGVASGQPPRWPRLRAEAGASGLVPSTVSA